MMGGLGAILLLVAAPPAVAALMRLPSIGSRRLPRDLLACAAVASTVIGLAALLGGCPVLGRAERFEVSLGPLDPAAAPAGAAWSLAPAAIALVFLAIALRTRTLALVGLAGAHLFVEVGAASAQLAAAPEAAGRGGLVVDPLAATLLGVSVLVGGVIIVYALAYPPVHLAQRGIDPARAGSSVAWLLVFVAAMNLLVLADDLRLLIVGWELTTLCSVMLIAFDGDAAALGAGRRALAYGLAGGVALGAAEWLAGPNARLSGLLVDGGGTAPVAVPLVLGGAILAAAMKSALVPFQGWLLGAMVAAAPVSALLHASAMVNAGSYLLMRLSPAIADQEPLGPLVVLLGAVSFAAAALAALRQHDLKRILALSTVSTLGLTTAAAGIGSSAALSAGLLLLVFHAVAKALAFLSVGTLEQATGTRELEDLAGALRTAPLLAAPLAIAAATLALPPFGLTVAKWAIIEAGARNVAFVVLLALGGAAYLALWTGVVGRLLVRRRSGSVARGAAEPGVVASADEASPGAPTPGRRLPRRQLAAVAVLAVASLGGLVLAAPLAAWLTDPAARTVVGSGAGPGLAAGWSVALGTGGFEVPLVAGLLLAASVAAVLAAARVRGEAPAAYLSGAGIAARPGTLHRAPGGRTALARSGGFYWGGGTLAWGSDSDAAGVPNGSVGRPAALVGWVLVASLVTAAVLAAVLLGTAGPGAPG